MRNDCRSLSFHTQNFTFLEKTDFLWLAGMKKKEKYERFISRMLALFGLMKILWAIFLLASCLASLGVHLCLCLSPACRRNGRLLLGFVLPSLWWERATTTTTSCRPALRTGQHSWLVGPRTKVEFYYRFSLG